MRAVSVSTRGASVWLRFIAAFVVAFATACVVAADEEDAPTDLLFRDFYKTPVGPRGLEPSAQLRALDGKTVRMRGYVVRQPDATPGVFILSPLPVELGDADDGLADDLPGSVVFVRADTSVPAPTGLVQVVGTLRVGPREEADGRVSQVRLDVNARQSAAIAHVSSVAAASASMPGSSP